MELDVRPVFTALLGDARTPITAGMNPRLDDVVEATRSALGTARRLGVTELGTSRKPLYVELTADPSAAGTPMFMGDDTLLLGITPISDRGRRFLDQAPGGPIHPGATWLDVDLGNVVPHEAGHGVLGELLPQVQAPTVRAGAWRIQGFDQRIVEEAEADVFAAIHGRTWMMSLAGMPVRDARLGVDYVDEGYATVDHLNQARAIGRGGVDLPSTASVHNLDGSTPHHFAGLLTPAYAIVEQHHGWHATEAVFTDTLGRLRARDYAIDVPTAARETARAAAAQLGSRDEGALAVRRFLTGNGSMG